MTDLAARPHRRPPLRHRAVALVCVAVVAGMVGAAYAAVPLYYWFCRVTGIGGTTQVATAAPVRIIDRRFEVRLDANLRGLPWTFQPAVRSVSVRGGEVATVDFVVENVSDRETVGTSTYNVTPEISGVWFNKIACFCFTEQRLKPGEKVTLPVTFFVDPAIDDDPDFAKVSSITLSYSFFPARTTAAPVAAAPAPAAVN